MYTNKQGASMEKSTKAIHVGQEPDPHSGAIVPPIQMTSTYVQASPGEFVMDGMDYTRAENPNFQQFEATMAALENGEYARSFGTGLACFTAILSTLKAGDKVVGIENLYSGTRRILGRVMKSFGIEFHEVSSDPEQFKKALEEHAPKMIFIESPTNPHLEVHDLKTLIRIAIELKVLTVVDNTLATPIFQNPLDMGADLVLHSGTKYLVGHSTALVGVVVSKHKEWDEKLYFARTAMGLTASPFNAWLASQGLKTLALRMKEHEKNALELAHWLESQEFVNKVYYPGLESHETHELAKSQMKGFGGLLSVEFDLDVEETRKMLSACKLFKIAESLGGVESTSAHLTSTCYASVSAEERKKRCIGDGFVRLSVGIEDIEDLKGDILQAVGGSKK
jgi:cystathionine beta-lyase/cystathionine gamma-synthase